MEWREPTWVPYRKHRPLPGLSWDEVVAASKEGPAYYHPDLVDRIEELEMRCIRLGQQIGQHSAIRDYWIELAEVVGASKGKETRYVFAEWHQTGPVHGRPITRDELRRKGARL